ncbi:hypothetical protein M9458_025546, partial [Cirrhinus mrigala]
MWPSAYNCRRLVRLTASNLSRRSLSNTSSPSHHHPPPPSSLNTNSGCQTHMRLQSGWPVTRAGRRGCTGSRWTTSHVSQSRTHSHPAGRIVCWTGVTAGRGSESIHWTEQT